MKRKSKIKRQMFTMGELMLIVGIVVIFLAVGIGLAVVKGGGGPLGKAREDARRVNCTGNLKQFGQAFANYTSAGENLRPAYAASGTVNYSDGTSSLALLIVSGELTDYGVYVCPSSTTKKGAAPSGGATLANTGLNCANTTDATVSYAYIPGLDATAGADSGIMADGYITGSSTYNHTMYGNILFGDGHVAGSTGTTSKNWIQAANWKDVANGVDTTWTAAGTDEDEQVGPLIR